jgi:anti-sigma regulatory factor (Ser/Thr protein kinase)
MNATAETLILPSELTELSQVGTWAAAAGARLALPDSTIFALDLCLEEAVSNIIRHGMPNAPPEPRKVHLTMLRDATLLRVIIEDDGVAFDPVASTGPALPTRLEDAAIGGLGIHLMRKFAQSMHYRRHEGVNRLTLDFPLV